MDYNGGEMSEIAKCQICGEYPLQSVYNIGGEVLHYSCCGIQAATIELWNRYAAAMEYAKTTAYWFSLPDGIKHPDDARAEKAMTDAETRVLEVFK